MKQLLLLTPALLLSTLACLDSVQAQSAPATLLCSYGDVDLATNAKLGHVAEAGWGYGGLAQAQAPFVADGDGLESARITVQLKGTRFEALAHRQLDENGQTVKYDSSLAIVDVKSRRAARGQGEHPPSALTQLTRVITAKLTNRREDASKGLLLDCTALEN